MEHLIHSLKHSLTITIFVFVMMTIVDYINLVSKGKFTSIIKGGKLRQYTISSFLGATPGCLGSFMNVSLFMKGVISLGAITGAMVATSGDEAFVMLAMIPRTALMIFGILFGIGIISAIVVDYLKPKIGIEECKECKLVFLHQTQDCRRLKLSEIYNSLKDTSLVRFLFLFSLILVFIGSLLGKIGPHEGWEKWSFIVLIGISLYIILTTPTHYLKEHIWKHIAKNHIWKIFLWSFFALYAVGLFMTHFDIQPFITENMLWVLFIAVLVGIIPQSGPHLIFVVMFSKGIIPFSILLASCIVQDGHGILPLLSYSIKDAVQIKIINFIIGLLIGLSLYSIGF